MADVRAHERFVEDQRRLLETFFDVAERPFGIGERGHRQPALPEFLCLGLVPLHVDGLGNARRLTLGGRSGRFQTLPSRRAFCAPGMSDATGSTLNGSGSH